MGRDRFVAPYRDESRRPWRLSPPRQCNKAIAPYELQEPATKLYGDRTYRARDPEGHIWTFGVTEKRMRPQEWDKASGFTTKKRLD